MTSSFSFTEQQILLHTAPPDFPAEVRTGYHSVPEFLNDAPPEYEFALLPVSPMDDLTVCITSFRRTKHLERCIRSLAQAGVTRIVIAAAEPDEDVKRIVTHYRESRPWTSFDVVDVDQDIGCNDLWALAAYRSRTERIIIMHDDDCLNEAFGNAYVNTIKPALDSREAGFVSWRADLIFDDGSHQPTDYFNGPTRLMPAIELASKILLPRNRLSLSPVVSILNRGVVIDACREAWQKLTAPECYERPGMLLGTELVVYQRHCEKFPKWMYVHEILSHYGSHVGSGTVRAQNEGHTWKLIAGYNKARELWSTPVGPLDPKIIFVYWRHDSNDEDETLRNHNAYLTWKFHFNESTFIECPTDATEVRRTTCGMGDARELPYIKDLFDYGCKFARPQDIVVYCNRDIGLTVDAYQRIVEGVKRGNGVTVCPRRRIDPLPGRMYRDLRNCWADGGFDVMAVTPQWWKQHRGKMPDMAAGAEAWDTVFRCLAEEWIDRNGQPTPIVRLDWQNSKAYTDHVAWHKNHYSNWIAERLTAPRQIHNRALALEFFRSRGNHALARELQPK